jgi:hypothetical protein
MTDQYITHTFDHFRNMLAFYGEGFLAPTPNPQAGGPPLVVWPQLTSNITRSSEKKYTVQ